MADNWSTNKAKALKVLGDKGKIPEPKGSFDKAHDEYAKAYAGMEKAYKEIQSSSKTLESAATNMKQILVQLHDLLKGDNLGPDPKNKDDKKKIDQAKAILNDYLGSRMDRLADLNKSLFALDKTISDIASA